MRSLLVRRKILRLYLVSVPMLYARCDVPVDAGMNMYYVPLPRNIHPTSTPHVRVICMRTSL